MPRPKLRNDELADTVVSRALELLTASGAAGFTTRRVAEMASTSPPAIYELFGSRAGLLRAVLLEGFRLLGGQLSAVPRTDDPVGDLVAMLGEFRSFLVSRPVLGEIMFSRPFPDFEPGPDDVSAALGLRRAVLDALRRAEPPGRRAEEVTDAAQALIALVIGLASQERAGLLASTRRSCDRRWNLAVGGLLSGLGVAP